MFFQHLHPWKLRWNLTITQLKRKIIFRTSIFRFHGNFPGCSRSFVRHAFCCAYVPAPLLGSCWLKGCRCRMYANSCDEKFFSRRIHGFSAKIRGCQAGGKHITKINEIYTKNRDIYVSRLAFSFSTMWCFFQVDQSLDLNRSLKKAPSNTSIKFTFASKGLPNTFRTLDLHFVFLPQISKFPCSFNAPGCQKNLQNAKEAYVFFISTILYCISPLWIRYKERILKPSDL